MQIEKNSFAVVTYTLRDSAGAVLESSDDGGEPIRYVHGYEMLVPGLEAGLDGLRAGDEKTIVVEPEFGFGERDEELVFAISRTDLPNAESIEPGDFIVAEDGDGDEADLRVISVHDDHVMVDGNHELAGKTLHFAVKIVEVRAATAEEIQEAEQQQAEEEAAQARNRELESELDQAVRQVLGELVSRGNLPN